MATPCCWGRDTTRPLLSYVTLSQISTRSGSRSRRTTWSGHLRLRSSVFGTSAVVKLSFDAFNGGPITVVTFILR